MGERADPLDLIDCSALAKVAMRTNPYGESRHALAERFGVQFGRAERDPDGVLVVGALPGGWLFIGQPGLAPELVERERRINADEPVSILDLTHASVLLRLSGARAADLFAKICLVDLADRSVPDGGVLRTAVAGVTATIIRDDGGGTAAGARSYLLLADRSYGDYLVEVLLDAGAELGITMAGGFGG
ncbi:MAG: hypothetical protein ACR2I7_09995 [Geodermatophilaceae bacterium]